MTKHELKSALPMVWEVFCAYEAENAPQSSKMAFYEAIHSEDYLDALTAFGTFEGKELVGIIATRKEGSHVALFFVEGAHHRQGIGRNLWNVLLEMNTSEIITVHSSLYAKPVYERLGFVQTGPVTWQEGLQYVPMEYPHFLNLLQQKDDEKAYAAMKRIAGQSQQSELYYRFLPDLAELLGSSRSYVRTRAFMCCCCQARWDRDGRMEELLPRMLRLFHDEKPSVVRQCLKAAREIVLFLPQLSHSIRRELETMDLSVYKESMSPLIRKDMDGLLELMNGTAAD